MLSTIVLLAPSSIPSSFALSSADINPAADVVASLYLVSVGVPHVPSAFKNLSWSPAAGTGTKPDVPSTSGVAPVIISISSSLFLSDGDISPGLDADANGLFLVG